MEAGLKRQGGSPAPRPHRAAIAALAAAFLFLTSVAVFGTLLEGYSQVRHPVSLLGASGVPRAQLFNLLGLLLPGLGGMLAAIDLRARLRRGASWWSRLGAQLALLSAAGMVAMGLLPLDPQDLESAASRMHGTAWTGWVVAFIAGAFALAVGLFREGGARRLAWASGAAGLTLLLAAFVLPDLLGGALAQRAAFLVWFGWFAYAARPASLEALPRS